SCHSREVVVMSRLCNQRVGFGLLCFVGISCAEPVQKPQGGGEKRPGVVARTEPRTEKQGPAPTGLAARTPDQIAGTGKFDTGKPNPTMRAKVEKTSQYKGTVASAGGNSVTVTVSGKQMTFLTDTNTFVYRAGDPR